MKDHIYESVYSHVMLDIETMGKGPCAAIVSIGAVCFDIEHAKVSPDSFYCRVDLESSVRCGGEIDASTVTWWMQQSDEARVEIFGGNRATIEQALLNFSEWMERTTDGAHVWGNGASFDNVILRGAYERCEILLPWAWWNDRCYRTMKGLHRDVPVERLGVAHDALSDAQTQAVHLLRILRPEFRGQPWSFAFSSGDQP